MTNVSYLFLIKFCLKLQILPCIQFKITYYSGYFSCSFYNLSFKIKLSPCLFEFWYNSGFFERFYKTKADSGFNQQYKKLLNTTLLILFYLILTWPFQSTIFLFLKLIVTKILNVLVYICFNKFTLFVILTLKV